MADLVSGVELVSVVELVETPVFVSEVSHG